jgi:uncharacterized protein (TIGR03083 family)
VSKQAYDEAAAFFISTIRHVGEDQWESSALGVWSVRDLVGHASRSITMVERFGAERSTTADIKSPAHHYQVSLAPDAIDDQIADRGRIAGRELGDDPLNSIIESHQRVHAVIDGLPEDTVINYTNGGIRLGDYLQTRVLELVVHTLDLANAIGIEAKPPREALAVTLHLLADLAVDSGSGGQLALAATGRALSSDRFSVLG